MKLSDFIVLSEKEKTSTVLHEGVLIAKRNCNGCMVFLFHLDSYYVETYCSLASKAVKEFRVFGNTRLLNPWLDTIAIDDLLH